MKKQILTTALIITSLTLISACGVAAPPAASASGTVTARASEEGVTVSDDTVTVSAKSAAFVVPDKASIRVGTEVTAATATEAQEMSSEKTNKVIEAMKARGIEEKNITTENYNMWEHYDRNGKPDGYQVSVMILLNDQPIDSVGDLISALTEAGADRFHGLSFYASNYEEAYDEAMKKAIDMAKKKAEVFAAAAGKEAGEVKSIVEGYQDMTYADSRTYDMAAKEAAMAYGAAEDSIGIEPGEAEINARVTVTYRLR